MSQHVITKYTQCGWTVVKVPPGCMTDLICSKTIGRTMHLHFVHVVVDGASKYSTLAKNTFIQNAFSNMAHPVYAHVNTHKCTVTLDNINLNTKILLRQDAATGMTHVGMTHVGMTQEQTQNDASIVQPTELQPAEQSSTRPRAAKK